MGKKKSTMPRLTEAEFTDQVLKYFRLHGWVAKHDRPARTAKGWRTAIQGDPGFGDIVAVKNGRKVMAELKVGTNQPTLDQLRWLAAWGEDGFLWYPQDWAQIAAVAEGRA